MTEQEIIKLLVEQNNKLMTIIEKFADKDINIVVNSYNNPSANVDARDTEISGNSSPINAGAGTQTVG